MLAERASEALPSEPPSPHKAFETQEVKDRIRRAAPGTVFLHLHGTPGVLTSRLEGRSEHFMPASLLASQLETLEPLGPDEPGYALDIDQPVEDMVAEAVEALRAHSAPSACVNGAFPA